MNDRNITNARFIQVNQLQQIDAHLTAKLYVDNAIDETSLRLDPNEILDLDNQDSIILNFTSTSPKKIIEIPTKAFIDILHEENERSRRDLGIDFYDESRNLVKNNQDNDFNDNKLTNIDSITVNRNPTSDNELANKKYIDNEIDKNTIVRFNQTLEKYLKITVGNDTYKLTKYNKLSITDVTEIKFPNIGIGLLQKWNIYCNNKINQARTNDFIKSTKTTSPTGSCGATTLPPIGDSFIYTETSGNNSGNDNIYVSWERTDIIQRTNITFYYNRFSILSHVEKNMGRLRIQLLLSDDTWSTVYSIEKNTQFNDNSTDWTLLNLDFTEENYGIKLIHDEIDSAHADMGFSNITITHSVY